MLTCGHGLWGGLWGGARDAAVGGHVEDRNFIMNLVAICITKARSQVSQPKTLFLASLVTGGFPPSAAGGVAVVQPWVHCDTTSAMGSRGVA